MSGKDALTIIYFLFMVFVSICVGVVWLIMKILYKIFPNLKKEKKPKTSLPHLNRTQLKGDIGEQKIYDTLKPFETYGSKFLRNLYIPKPDGQTTEIDMLMLSHKGIFVIESKNYSGWIYGNEDEHEWYQTIPTRKNYCHKDFFYNPIMQNRSHIKHLKTLVGDIPMCNIVVFGDNSNLKNIETHSDDVNLMVRRNVFNHIKMIWNKSNTVLSSADIEKIYTQLFPYTQADATTKTQHIENIQNKWV